MVDSDLFKDRILRFIESEGISIREFERSCGFSNGYFNKVKDFSMQKVNEIAKVYPRLSATWVLTGETDMLYQEPTLIEKDIIQRVNQYCSVNKINHDDLANLIGLDSDEVGYYMGLYRKADYDFISNIIKVFRDLSPDWLLTGKGSMLKSESSSQGSQQSSSDYTLIAELKKEISALKDENNQLKGENKILRELAGFGERKESGNKSA